MILGTVMAVAGCAGSGGSDLPYEADAYPDGWINPGDVPTQACLSQNVWAHPDFDWLMIRPLEIQITVVHLDGEPWPEVVVSVFDDASDLPGNQTLLAEGMTDADGLWTGTAVLPTDQAAVNVVVNIMGAKNRDRLPVADGRVIAEFGRGE
jgi:hypothetical protein